MVLPAYAASEVNMALVEVVAVLALLSVGSVSQVTITNPPQNAAVVEGKDITFNCTAEDNGSPVTVGWRFTPNGSSSEVPLATGTTLTGIEMVTVSGGPRTTLTFSGVRRDVNGGTVVCVAATDRSTPANLTVQWPPDVKPEGMVFFLCAEDSSPFNFTVDEGNPRSNMTITGPSQEGNRRVFISSEGGGRINGVSIDDTGTHIATWRNDAGSATFTLEIDATFCCRVGCIVGIVLAIIVIIIVLAIAAVVVTVFLVRMCCKRRQKKSEGEKEDKGVSLT